jgi:hypothetical protein
MIKPNDGEGGAVSKSLPKPPLSDLFGHYRREHGLPEPNRTSAAAERSVLHDSVVITGWIGPRSSNPTELPTTPPKSPDPLSEPLPAKYE